MTTCTASTWSSPDVSYLIKNQNKVRGIFITHGHEDHIGALPYVLRSLNAPIYATRMSAGLIRLKLEEHRLLDKTKIITCEAGDVIKAGKFTVEFIHVNHSIADAVAFAIKCPVGTCVHTGDFKIDATPIQGGMIDLARLGQLGNEGCWPCWPTPPTWSVPAIPAVSAAWAIPLTHFSRAVRSASSSLPSQAMWTGSSRSSM